jgi:hypothetical protein
MPASFESGNNIPASFPNNNINKVRWTQEEHKTFMEEYEKYGNNCTQIARVLSTQTPAQIKKHPECFFKQNLKTNSAAVKQYGESLSPNNKAHVLVNTTNAHGKQRKSLSPEKKVKILETNAAAHKKLHESLPPEKKVKILETDDDAHKKKQESLSPEDKVLFVKNNTAAQHKHCKFFSPGQKAQVLTINAAEQKKHQEFFSPEHKNQVMTIDAVAHKKQYELLPPEKKARRMEIRTEQHHEHLTEEEKKISAQIRSVAATLYEKGDLDKPTVELLREHFYKDPTLALAHFYCCSTVPRVAIFNDKLQADVDGPVIWNRISNLIGSPIGQEEAMLCQETFNNLDHSHTRIAACASCCECLLSADGQQGIIEMKIDDFPSEFLLTESQKECLTASLLAKSDLGMSK